MGGASAKTRKAIGRDRYLTKMRYWGRNSKTKGAVRVADEIETVEGEGESNSAFYSAMYKGIYTKRSFKMKGLA